MKTLDLQPAHLRMVLSLIHAFAPDADVFAFGSRVHGGSHNGSDLDLVLRNPLQNNSPHRCMASLRAAFAESNLPFTVDILDWSRIPESFRREVERESVILHHAETVPA